jgi:hypothetical protein
MTHSVKKPKSKADRKGLKRKLAETQEEPTSVAVHCSIIAEAVVHPLHHRDVKGADSQQVREQIRQNVDLLKSAGETPAEQIDKVALRRAAHQLAELCKQGAFLTVIFLNC